MATTLNIDFSQSQGQITLQGSDLDEIQTHSRCYGYPSKYEEDRIKTEGATVATTQNIDFSNTQGQVTPQSMVETR